MSREKELFRDNLERLDKAFPGKELLTQTEAAAYCGVNRITLREHVGTVPGGTRISKTKRPKPSSCLPSSYNSSTRCWFWSAG